ncbi:MAG: insulinase family protein, partial [Candidatus Cellulosilyticum pullistercoris]|nr:insulinase family protein [Candidatus Cellulosilyticum pullistercoris]
MKNKTIFCSIIVILMLFQLPTYGKVTGFKEISKEKYDHDVLHTYEHEASGLEVIWIENKDINKTFMIGVKTPTTNDTGVNHIIEHTLFTGSKAFPSSSLFFDANEAYPSTYMNALTSGDMTIFPFSTPYLPCYEKLLAVYLDAVFRPNFLETPYGFYEEGFHVVPQEGRCGGVVYNEMKGANGSIERMIYRGIRNMIFEGSHYAYDSGGTPNAIPTLSYKEFIETYQRYYYPGNMKVIVYGDIPIEKTLEQITPYLNNQYQKQPSIDLSVEKLSERVSQTYEILPTSDKGCIARSFVLEGGTSARQIQDLDLWMTAYLMSPKSYFQSQLLSQGIQAKWLKDDDLPYTVYTVVLTDIPCSKLDTYNKLLDRLIDEVPNHLVKNVFLEQDIIKEAKWIWQKQESSNNRGIEIGQSILDSWAHQKEVNQYYLKKSQINEMKALDDSVSQLLFSKAKKYAFTFLPGNNEIEDPEKLSVVDTNTWEKIYEEMKIWQSKKVDLETVHLEEMVVGPDSLPSIIEKDDYWEMETRVKTDLVRSELYLNTSHIEKEELPYLFLYSYLLEESAKDITPFSGIIDTQCTAYPVKDGYWPCFKLSIITPKEETNHGVLFNEARSYLRSRPNSWYRQKLMEYTMNMKASSQNSSIATLSQLCLGSGGERGAYLYQQSYPQYVFCQELLSVRHDFWINHIKDIDEKLYHKGGTILATTIPEKGKNLYAKSWECYLETFPKLPNLKATYTFEIPDGTYIVKSNAAIDNSFMAMCKEEGIDGIDYLLAVSYTHLRAHETGSGSRMPS